MSFSKRMQLWRDKIDPNTHYPLVTAVELLKEFARTKFQESVEVAINLGIDAGKSEQAIRGATILPRGHGKSVRVAVFAQGEQAEAATVAGADIVGFDDLVERIQAGEMGFDVVIATPSAMPVVGRLGKILGPHGLMPNPKVGTVSDDVGQATKDAKKGQVSYKTDKNGIVHCLIGKISFDIDALKENLECVLADLKKLKPDSAKGIYLKKISLSTTMGPGIIIDQSSLVT